MAGLTVASTAFLWSSFSRADDAGTTGVVSISGTVTRVLPDGTSAETEHAHPGGVPLNAVNYYDCAADIRYDFALNTVNSNSANQLVAYVGSTDCTVASSRTGSSPTCFPVLASSPSPSTDAVQHVSLHVQDLVQAAFGPATTTYTAGTSGSCFIQPTPAASNLTLYFFFVDVLGNAILDVAQPYPLILDTQAPQIGSGFTILASDRALTITLPASTNLASDVVSWQALCDPPPGQETDADLYVLIEAGALPTTDALVPNDALVSVDALVSTDAKTTTDASSDATSSSDASGDASANFVPFPGLTPFVDDAGADDDAGDAGAEVDAGDAGDAAVVAVGSGVDAAGIGIPANDASIPATGLQCSGSAFNAYLQGSGGTTTGKPQTYLGNLTPYLCGVAGATDTSLQISGLQDKFNYDIGLVAVDALGNASPVSAVCANPSYVPDFFDQYLAEGGGGGGGFCDVDGVGVPAGTSALGILFGAASAALVRRRRKR